MPTYFVASGGSNTAPYDTWAKAATSLQTALTAANASGDIVVLQHDGVPAGDAQLAADTTYTFAANVSLITSTNSGTSTITPTAMGTANWVGNSTTFRFVTLAGAFRVFIFGLTIRTAGATSDNIVIGSTDGAHYELNDCYLWSGNTATATRIGVGTSAANGNSYIKLKNCTLRFGNASQGFNCSGCVDIEGGSVTSAGSIPTTLFTLNSNSNATRVVGFNASAVTGTLVASQTSSCAVFSFVQCRLGAGVVRMASQTPANKSSAQVFLHDCSDGDTHGLFEYHDAFGSIVSSTGTYLTAGAAAQSWQITTTANCSFGTPFVTPWIDLYNTGTTAQTYKLELLRNNGTASAYTDAQVWGEFSVKNNSGFTNPSFFTDRQALVDWAAGTAGATLAAGVGTGSWTIASSNSPASFIVDSGAAVTPAENGAIRARVAVGLASVSNLFLDPQIRT